MIRFIPNDPLARAPWPFREQRARPEPPSSRAGFQLSALAPQAIYEVGTPEFLSWQCREAALAALEVWSAIAPPLAAWHGGVRLLALDPDAGPGLNARYRRGAIRFFSWQRDGKTTHTAASTDAVAHEVGHALLDAVRPDLWQSFYTEIAAFHEAFADCIALLVGFFDEATCSALLNSSALGAPNFLEALAEDVADGVHREMGPQHPHSLPRRALNKLRWRMPIHLPGTGPPSVLATDPHSFGRIFTGSFYDLVVGLFRGQPAQDVAGLRAAALTAGRLLAEAAASAPEAARFFRSVGRAMILADEALNGGAHHLEIRNAFAAHDVALGSSVTLAPSSALEGSAPLVDPAAGTVHLARPSRQHLGRRLAIPARARVEASPLEMGGRIVALARHRRRVDLESADRSLRGVVAPAVEAVLVGDSNGRAAVLGELPDPVATCDETVCFVQTLLEMGTLETGNRPRSSGQGHATSTHGMRRRGGHRFLERTGFSC